MAKDVVFESERYEKWQTLRRWLIPVAVLLAMTLIVAAAALIIRGKSGKAHVSGEDMPYPYSWREGKDGVITLEIDRSAAPDYLWILEQPGDSVSVAETQMEAEKKTEFTLMPTEAGRSVLVFSLLRAEDEMDRIYELSALMESTRSGKNLSSTLLSISGKALLGTIRGGADAYPYLVQMDEDGDLAISITDNAPPAEETDESEGKSVDGGEIAQWECVSGDETLALVLGVVTTENGATAFVRPGTGTGTVQVRMTNSGKGIELVLELETDGSGAIQVLSHSLNAGNHE